MPPGADLNPGQRLAVVRKPMRQIVKVSAQNAGQGPTHYWIVTEGIQSRYARNDVIARVRNLVFQRVGHFRMHGVVE